MNKNHKLWLGIGLLIVALILIQGKKEGVSFGPQMFFAAPEITYVAGGAAVLGGGLILGPGIGLLIGALIFFLIQTSATNLLVQYLPLIVFAVIAIVLIKGRKNQ